MFTIALTFRHAYIRKSIILLVLGLFIIHSTYSFGEILDRPDSWIIKSKEINVHINKTDGMINQIISNQPAPIPVIPENRSMIIYLKYPDVHSGLSVVTFDVVLDSRLEYRISPCHIRHRFINQASRHRSLNTSTIICIRGRSILLVCLL